MKGLIKRLLFYFILLFVCPSLMLNVSVQPAAASERLVHEALAGLREQSVKRAENNIMIESAIQEMTAVKNTSATTPKQRQPTGQSAAAAASGQGAAQNALAKKVNGKAGGKNLIYRSVGGSSMALESEMLQVNENLFVSAEDSDKSFDPLAPRKGTLPGGKQTLSQMDEPTPLEATVLYRFDQKRAYRLQINKEDENSPIYTPRPHGRDMFSAGVFMDMEVRKDLKLEVGGQHRSLTEETGDFQGGFTDTGASLGLKYSF